MYTETKKSAKFNGRISHGFTLTIFVENENEVETRCNKYFRHK